MGTLSLDVAIFKRFKNTWNYIYQTKYEDASTDDEEVAKYVQNKHSFGKETSTQWLQRNE